MEKKEKQAAAILLAIIILLASFAIFLSYQKGDENRNNPPKPMDRTIRFPEDEGEHDEPAEYWILFMKMKVDGNDLFAWILWSKEIYDPSNGTVVISISDPSNYTGKIYRTDTYVSRNYEYSEDWLDLKFSMYGNQYFNFKSTDNCTENYLLSTNSRVEDRVYGIDAAFRSERNPTLFAQQYNGDIRYGSLYFGNGTVFGYLQSRFSILGSISIDGVQSSISGNASLLHYWGGASIEIFEFLYGEYQDKDIFSITYYSAGGEKIILEQLYVIYRDACNLYSSYRGEDIGIHIVNDTYQSLEGHNYSFYPSSYTLDPTDPYHGRAYAFNWTIKTTYDDLNITMNPISRDQFSSVTLWVGAAYIKESGNTEGWGYTVENKRYLCSPYVDDVKAEKHKEGDLWELTVSAQVYDTLPIDKVILRYNSSSGVENSTTMSWDESLDAWSATVHSFSTGENASFSVYVRDSAGAEYSTEYHNITF